MSETDSKPDAVQEAIVKNETQLLAKAREALLAFVAPVAKKSYDQELLSLRDQIAEARLEDVPPLVQQMERLQAIAAQRAEMTTVRADPRSPYFGHLGVKEKGRVRDVLIGNATYVDAERGVRIVDWRDAPVSRLYYRYGEGEEYEEEFGGRTQEGEIVVRRSVVIMDGELRRVMSPQGTFVSGESGWKRLGHGPSKLSGGQGVAVRPPVGDEYKITKGKLGVGVQGREDRHLPEIPALIDPRQFDLISKPASGIVVIQGGAGSGKTTIGLHRLAYLAFNDSRRFAPDKMLVVVFNEALATYISRVLPALRVEGVQVATYERWAEKLRKRHFAQLPDTYSEDTPVVVTRLKKHPVMLQLIDARVKAQEQEAFALLTRTVANESEADRAMVKLMWERTVKLALSERVRAIVHWLRGERDLFSLNVRDLSDNARSLLGAALGRIRKRTREVLWDWAEILTDETALRTALDAHSPGEFAPGEIASAVRWCADHVTRIVDPKVTQNAPSGDEESESVKRKARRASQRGLSDDDSESLSSLEESSALDEALGSGREFQDDDGSEGNGHGYGVLDDMDGDTPEPLQLDREDDALLLRLHQRKRGPLQREGKDRKDAGAVLLYEHLFVDEAQDLSPVELAVLLDCVTPARSVTLAGDTAQRLMLDNGFRDWKTLLSELGLSSISVEPLKIGYRSTIEVLELAREVLGPLAEGEPPVATRSGAPVEMHVFPNMGSAVAFLGDALRELSWAEPRASVCVIARDPSRADLYWEGLRRADVPKLSRVRNQDFGFKPGVEVTDIRQVKGLEFDYVVLVDVTASQYPTDDESRYLLHIGATRAAHQLWMISAGEPSALIPSRLTRY